MVKRNKVKNYCYLLLHEARELIKNNDNTNFFFVDINCSVAHLGTSIVKTSFIILEINKWLSPYYHLPRWLTFCVNDSFSMFPIELIKDKPLFLLFCLTIYFYFLPIVCIRHTFNSTCIIWSSKPIMYPSQ